MSCHEVMYQELNHKHYTQFVTGVVVFVGSNYVEKLIGLHQSVVKLENIET